RARIAGAQQTEGKAGLAARRTRQELAERHEIGVARLVDPSAARHELVAEVAEMRDRTSEGRHAEFEESEKDLDRGAVPGRSSLRSQVPRHRPRGPDRAAGPSR